MTSAASRPERGPVVSVVPLVPAWRVDRTFDYFLPDELKVGVRRGALVRVPFGNRRVRAVVTALEDGEVSGLQEVAALVAGAPVAPGRLVELFTWLAHRYAVPLGRAFERAVPPRVRLRIAPPEPFASSGSAGRLPAYAGGAELLDSLAEGRPGSWCVRTVMGEERARIIVELVDAALRHGGQALVAVPEVRFGSAVIDALAARWPQLARLDSAQPDADRAHAWLRVGNGTALGAGGRATVLAPADDLRLVVVDEEHHVSFKEDRAPRYDARRVALERARLQKAACVFVSPTPSVECGAAAAGDRFGSVSPARADERAARPIVETTAPPRNRVLARSLHERIRDAIRAGERAALLVPARGYARAVWCGACHRSVRCPVCESGLFFDRARRSVRCARCRFESSAPERCPACGATEFRYVGAGSERLAEQLSKAFPRATIGRMDPDVIDRFEGRPPVDADIYVTTWIGTKPALRPAVRLVGVLGVDSLLRRPDFRAAESTYQALAAMAEWAGPAAAGGRLVIQTEEPRHYAVQAVVRADYIYFLEHELAERKELGYPPFAELIRATSFGARKRGLIERVGGAARAQGARVLGPIQVRTVVGEGRLEEGLEVLIKAADAEPVASALRGILGSVPAGSRLKVDVDPR